MPITLRKLQAEIQENLKKRKIEVEVVSQGNKRNQALSEIRISGLTKDLSIADSKIIFYSDTMVAKYAEGNFKICEWIINNFLIRPPYNVYCFISAFDQRYL